MGNSLYAARQTGLCPACRYDLDSVMHYRLHVPRDRWPASMRKGAPRVEHGPYARASAAPDMAVSGEASAPASTVDERFWSNVAIGDADDCWEWNGKRQDDGYGRFWLDGRYVGAHRWAYESQDGVVIPDGFDVDHLCRNRPCVNPAHLQAVTHRENVLSGQTVTAINAAKTHCDHGHEFTPENTYVYGDRRQCKQCTLERVTRYRKAKVASEEASALGSDTLPNEADAGVSSSSEATTLADVAGAGTAPSPEAAPSNSGVSVYGAVVFRQDQSTIEVNGTYSTDCACGWRVDGKPTLASVNQAFSMHRRKAKQHRESIKAVTNGV